jgi:hypothetical protein
MFEDLPKATLLKIIDTYAKAWQAMDGAYFLALEKEFGIDVAMEMDKEAWKLFSPIEARRIMREFGVEPNGGLKSLEKALDYRVYARLNKQSIVWKDDKTLIFTPWMSAESRRQGIGRDFQISPVDRLEKSSTVTSLKRLTPESRRAACFVRLTSTLRMLIAAGSSPQKKTNVNEYGFRSRIA